MQARLSGRTCSSSSSSSRWWGGLRLRSPSHHSTVSALAVQPLSLPARRVAVCCRLLLRSWLACPRRETCCGGRAHPQHHSPILVEGSNPGDRRQATGDDRPSRSRGSECGEWRGHCADCRLQSAARVRPEWAQAQRGPPRLPSPPLHPSPLPFLPVAARRAGRVAIPRYIHGGRLSHLPSWNPPSVALQRPAHSLRSVSLLR